MDAAPGYRNGYGKPRRLSTCCGKIKRPRVRGLKERFESRILPLFARRTKEVGELLPELYLHGLDQRQRFFRFNDNYEKRNKKVAAASALIWRTLMVAEKRFRRLNAHRLLPDVYAQHHRKNKIIHWS